MAGRAESSVPGSRQNVCVTGAGGYIASWLVKLLLSRGYAVHATVRDPSKLPPAPVRNCLCYGPRCGTDRARRTLFQNAHLGRLEGASENLRLFKANVLDQDSLAAAVAGCQGVFHAACPVPTDKAEVLAPAVQGTLNILQACSANNVQKVVVVSSTAAVHFNPNWPRDRPKDENCWSDISFCEKNEDWYMVAKVIAEKTALEYAEKTGLNIVTACPTMALGPLLRPVVNVSHEFLIYIIKGGPTVMKNIPWHIVDVRDVADALLLLYEKEESTGRYICAPHHISAKDLVNLLKKARPNYNYVNCDDDLDPNSIVTPLMSEKLKNLGWKPREKLEETFLDSIEYYEKARLLQDIEGRPCQLAPDSPSTAALRTTSSYLRRRRLQRHGRRCNGVRDRRRRVHRLVTCEAAPLPRLHGDKKTAHLRRLENAAENLRVFKADLLDYDAMAAAVAGCQGVFHVATPLQMLGPAVTGTTNVLKAASAASVRRVVVVSSIVAVEINPKDWPQGKVRDESCWSDREFCRSIELVPGGKIISEEAALEYGRRTGLDVVTINPGLVFGPLLQPTVNASSQFLVYLLKGGPDQVRNKLWHIVDVRDLADAMLLLYEVPEASGRHICAPHVISVRDLVDLLRSMYPDDYPFITKESICDRDHPAPMTSDKLKKLGWSCRPLEETIADTVGFCQRAGFLEDAGRETPCHINFEYTSKMPAAAAAGNAERAVCVTGAGGYVASWLVKLLLSRGYTVHGTVRDLSDRKTAHLKQFENASEKLKLFRADLLDYDAMAAAIAGCQGVFHVATTVPSGKITDPEREMLGPAVNGTTNVLKAASAANVRRVVVVSSMVAVEIDPKDWPKDKIKDEGCWSDKEACKKNEDWYSVAKITSEQAAIEYGKQNGLDVVTINPALVFGPLLQPTLNTSCQFLVYFLKGGPDQTRNKLWHIVDDSTSGTPPMLFCCSSGRHICAPHFISARDLLDLLKSMYPDDYPFMSRESICDTEHPAPMTSEKLMKLGWKARPLKETIADTVEYCQQAGFLVEVEGTPYRFPPLYNKI
ncbi:hypothetical protein U9M48_014775 [Paspalum notatum var. saurae]|uniref:NAD-dependent epimerase/dehydratase domain-containing protein n=1 Tax=Paspalum notatum var. saurae TaxID=547442 RepID=A0AAQ3T593_PASNO